MGGNYYVYSIFFFWGEMLLYSRYVIMGGKLFNNIGIKLNIEFFVFIEEYFGNKFKVIS